MPISGGSIPLGATFAPTGGTATTISELAPEGANGTKFLIEDSAAYALRSTLHVTTTEATPNSGYPGGYTPNKRRASFKKSRLLADGSYFVDQINIEIIAHPESTTSHITELRSAGLNILDETDFDGLWNNGSRA